MATGVVRVDETLIAAATEDGKLLGRSTASQLAHWARLGRAIEAAGISTASVRTVLGGEVAFDDLSVEDQATVAAAWSIRMAEMTADLDMAAEHTAAGTPYSELDDDGNVVTVPPGPVAADDDPRVGSSYVRRDSKRGRAASASAASGKKVQPKKKGLPKKKAKPIEGAEPAAARAPKRYAKPGPVQRARMTKA